MNISKEQIRAVEQGEPVRIHADDIDLVVVRADVYDRLAGGGDHPRESYPAVLRALDQDDENPAQYLKYLNETQ